MKKQLDFFYFLGSTYTYLSVNRAANFAHEHGVHLNWRPFSVRAIMLEQSNIPFANKPMKMKYMWRDIERRAQYHEIPYVGSPRYPIDANELANRVATLATMEGWGPEFARAAYFAWFINGNDPGDVVHLRAILQSLGQEVDMVIEKANGELVGSKYVAETEIARNMGIFGSPTFACAGEIFWGDDRLEEAIAWCKSH